MAKNDNQTAYDHNVSKQQEQEAALHRRQFGEAVDKAGDSVKDRFHKSVKDIAVAGTILSAPGIMVNHQLHKDYDKLHGIQKQDEGDWARDKPTDPDKENTNPNDPNPLGHNIAGPNGTGLKQTGYKSNGPTTAGPNGETGVVGGINAGGLKNPNQPQNGGVSINVDGHNINLQPGTSVTIGKDGQVSFSSNQLQPDSVQASQHPFDHTIDQQGFQRQYGLQKDAYEKGLQANPSDPNAAYQQSFQNQPGAVQGGFSQQAFQNSQQMRQDYAQKGYGQTAAGIGKKQESAVKDQMHKEQQKSKNKSLQTDGPEVEA